MAEFLDIVEMVLIVAMLALATADHGRNDRKYEGLSHDE